MKGRIISDGFRDMQIISDLFRTNNFRRLICRIKFLPLLFLFSLSCVSPVKADSIIKAGDTELIIASDMSATIHGYVSNNKSVLARSDQFFTLNEIDRSTAKFRILNQSFLSDYTHPVYGKCNKASIICSSSDNKLEVTFTFYTPENIKGAIICYPEIKNISAGPVSIEKISIARFILDARDFAADRPYDFWSFQGGTYFERYDWIFPLTKNYRRENFQGMNVPDYGGGMPVVDLWTKASGIGFASLSMQPEQISLPVHVLADGKLSFGIRDTMGHQIKAGDTIAFIPIAIITHKGDYYNALKSYSGIMQMQGMKFPRTPDCGFEPEWCAWGYIRDFNKQQILASLDKAKSLGFKWVTIDDGWQNADGDWEIDRKKFPGGESEFKELISFIKSKGFKVRLWWVPFETHDSSYNPAHYPGRLNEYGMKFQSRISLEHPDWFMNNADGSRIQVSYWNSYMLCPAYEPVKNHFKKFITKAIKEWGVDGLKVDGQNFNAVSPCYNPEHHHKDPQDACHAVPKFMQEVFETACSLDSQQIVQLCPCGTNFSIYNLPYTNQTVASDPTSSWQIRTKGKTFKAISGDAVAYSGDHVELTPVRWDDKNKTMVRFRMDDFASTVGIGGVPASKFTMMTVAQADSGFMLTPEKEAHWKKWLDIYEKEKPSRGTYLNLYDIAYDKPETHVIQKDDVMYYSLFSDDEFSGDLELRGLKKDRYRIINLETGDTLDTIIAGNEPAKIHVNFRYYLLLKAVPY